MCRAFHPFTVSVSRELPSEGQQVQTQLHRSCSEDFYTYHNVPWKIYIRKEVRWGGGGQHGDRLVSKCYGDKGGFSPRPCRVGDAGDAGEPGWSPSWQVFYPKDSINNPLLLDLVFRQVRHRAGPEAPPGVPWELGYPHAGVMVYSSHHGSPIFPC